MRRARPHAHFSSSASALTWVVAAIWLLLGSAACFVDGHLDTATVEVTLDLGEVQSVLETLPGPRSSDGLLHLDEVPAMVQVTVSGPGIETPIIAVWPKQTVPSGSSEVDASDIRLELEVPAGLQRRFDFIAYLCGENGETRAWSNDEEVVRDLAGGATSQLPVRLKSIATGTVRGVIDDPQAASVRQIWVVDGDPVAGQDLGPGVALPPADVNQGAFEVHHVPTGRWLSFRLALDTGQVVSPHPPVQLVGQGQTLEVTLGL